MCFSSVCILRELFQGIRFMQSFLYTAGSLFSLLTDMSLIMNHLKWAFFPFWYRSVTTNNAYCFFQKLKFWLFFEGVTQKSLLCFPDFSQICLRGNQCFFFCTIFYMLHLTGSHDANCWISGLSLFRKTFVLYWGIIQLIKAQIMCYLMLVNTWGLGVSITAVTRIKIPDYICGKVPFWYFDCSFMREIHLSRVFLNILAFFS